MRAVQPGSMHGLNVRGLNVRGLNVVGLSAVLAVLATLAGTVALSPVGWFVGVTAGVITNAALGRGLAHHGVDRLGPADLVTLTRATLACGVAALTADSFGGPTPVPTLVALAVVALILDAVDGRVARRTKTASALGARFDMEVDAFLILVLCVFVSRSAGSWVLTIGFARYAFVAAGWVLPWMRTPVPPRYWCKVVAAIQGVVLTFAAADVAPRYVTLAALATSVALLAESFGRHVWWLWQRERAERGRIVLSASRPEPGGSGCAAAIDELADGLGVGVAVALQHR